MSAILAGCDTTALNRITKMFELSTDDGSTVTIIGTLPCAPDAAFAAFIEPDLLAQWWQTEANTDPRTGGKYHMAWPGPGWNLRGEYLEVEAATALRFTWSWDHETTQSEVGILFTPEADRTVVTISHTYSHPDERDGYVDGWLHFLPRIADVA